MTQRREPVTGDLSERSNIHFVQGVENAVLLRDGHAIVIEGGAIGYGPEFQYATDRDAVAFLLSAEESPGYEGRLFFSDGTTCEEISDQVQEFTISSDGSTVLYLKNCTADNTGSLYVYRTAEKESSLVSENAGRTFAVSPHGQAVAYQCFVEKGADKPWEVRLRIDNEEPIRIAEDLNPIALSDDGQIVYAMSGYTGRESELETNGFYAIYPFSSAHSLKLLSNSIIPENVFLDFGEIIFNADRTQVLFSDADGIRYSESGSEPILLEAGRIINSNEGGIIFSKETRLSNKLMVTFFHESISDIWYFTSDLESVLCHSLSYDGEYQMIGDSVLLDSPSIGSKLIYVENINDFGTETNEEIHIGVAVPSVYEFTSDRNIYYVSEADDSTSGYTISRATYDTDFDGSEVVMSGCIDIERYAREGEPDLIYLLKYREPAFEGEPEQYLATHFFDLYAVEDKQGSVPFLVAENVDRVECGDFGVVYRQLYKSAPQLEEYLTNPDLRWTGVFTLDGVSHSLKVFYGVDGVNFENVADIKFAIEIEG